jgi:hypothetical protein
MIDRDGIASILDQYEKHGWKLRRVLLSRDLLKKDPKIVEAFDGAEMQDAEIDAAWFSRSSRPGLTAWELRYLSTTPYALLETIRDGTATDELEAGLNRTVERLIEAVSRQKPN